MLVAGAVVILVTATMRAALLNAAAAKNEAEFLSREMHHRVKNLFAVIASMSSLSARERPDAQDALFELRQRVQALSQAHDVAISDTTFVTLSDLMCRLMSPYRDPRSSAPRVLVVGEDIEVPYGCVTPIGLIFHEMATNAVKYGALATADGHVRLSWRVRDASLLITWQEFGAKRPDEEGLPGFGTVLVDVSVAQMRGTMHREWLGDGLVMRLAIPLEQEKGIRFPTERMPASQSAWERTRSSLSAHRASRRFFRKKPAIGDSRS